MALPDAAESLLLEAVAGCPPVGDVREFAGRLLATESTLRRTCKELGLQPPRTLLRWGQALEAVALRNSGSPDHRGGGEIRKAAYFKGPSGTLGGAGPQAALLQEGRCLSATLQ